MLREYLTTPKILNFIKKGLDLFTIILKQNKNSFGLKRKLLSSTKILIRERIIVGNYTIWKVQTQYSKSFCLMVQSLQNIDLRTPWKPWKYVQNHFHLIRSWKIQTSFAQWIFKLFCIEIKIGCTKLDVPPYIYNIAKSNNKSRYTHPKK